MIFYWSILASWAVFILVWITYALRSKRTIKRGNWVSWTLLRAAVILAVLLVLSNGSVHEKLRDVTLVHAGGTAVAIGAVLTALGIAFAVWARVYIGRNWGMPMSIKENPELVTSGPYALVRHPIYTGVLLALLGSMLASGPAWLLLFAFFCVYFIYSANKEEVLLRTTFPNEYPVYEQRTKKLIPFVW